MIRYQGLTGDGSGNARQDWYYLGGMRNELAGDIDEITVALWQSRYYSVTHRIKRSTSYISGPVTDERKTL
jgi:hypothetical protein